MTNLEIAELLRAAAAAYQLKDAAKNKFRIIAYQRAADAVEHLSSEVKDVWDEGKLDDIPGIGESLASHLDEIFKTGRSKHFNALMKGLPPKMFELLPVPGIGPKTAFKLAKSGEIPAEVKTSLKKLKERPHRLLLPYAMTIADEVITWMKKEKAVSGIEALGSLRRRASTIGDIDIAAATTDSQKTLIHFTKYPKAKKILEKGETTASIILPGDIQVDLMVQSPEAYGALLQHFTGSKHHNIALREYALKRDLSLSEYGIKSKGKLEKFASEETFYKKLGMEWIPPELREDVGEIESAVNRNLPALVELKDIKADLQIHSDFDIETSHDLGVSSMEEIIKEAGSLGYEYIAFTEHNPSQSGHNEKQILEILKRKKEKIEKLNSSIVKKGEANATLRVKKVFNSLEVDILPNGKLALPEAAFDLLDFVLVSVHSSFGLSRAEMTKRVLTALSYPKVKIFAHPTARKINQREGIEVNWPEVFAACKSKNIWLEINADPMRLDLPDFLIKEAIEHGVKLTLGTDAHHKDGLKNMEYGIFTARRGWAEKKDIINTKNLVDFEKMISKA